MSKLRDNQALFADGYGLACEYDSSLPDRFVDKMDARKAFVARFLDAIDRALAATGPGTGECCTFPSCACADPAACDRPAAPQTDHRAPPACSLDIDECHRENGWPCADHMTVPRHPQNKST